MHRDSCINNSGSLLSSFLSLAQNVRGKKLLEASAVNKSLQSLLRDNSHFCFFSFSRKQSYNSFSATTKYSESESLLLSSYLSVSQTFFEKVVTELQHSQFNLLHDEKDYNGWFFTFNLIFGKIFFAELIVVLPQSLEHLIVDHCMSLLVILLLRNCLPGAIHNLITTRAACKKLHSFYNSTGVGILVSLTTNIDSGLKKIVETFHMGVLNESIIFSG